MKTSARLHSGLTATCLLLISFGPFLVTAKADDTAEVVLFPTARVFVGQETRGALGALVTSDSWYVDLAEIPETVLRESYAARDASIECTSAATAILEMEDQSANDRPSDGARNEIVSTYAEQCLVTLGEVSNPKGGYRGSEPEDAKTLLRMIGTKGVERLRRSLLVSDEAHGAPCSGTLAWANLEGSRTLVIATAAHCVGRPQMIEGQPHISVGSVFDFLDFQGRRYQIDLVNGRRSVAVNPLRDDLALIALGTDFDEQTIGMHLSSSSSGGTLGAHLHCRSEPLFERTPHEEHGACDGDCSIGHHNHWN